MCTCVLTITQVHYCSTNQWAVKNWVGWGVRGLVSGGGKGWNEVKVILALSSNPKVDRHPFAATVAAAALLQYYQVDPVHQPLGLSSDVYIRIWLTVTFASEEGHAWMISYPWGEDSTHVMQVCRQLEPLRVNFSFHQITVTRQSRQERDMWQRRLKLYRRAWWSKGRSRWCSG